MRSLILFLVAFCAFTASAGETAEKKKALDYSIVSSAKSSKVPAGQSKVIFRCWAGSSNTLGSQLVSYSVDGANATVTTDKSGYFVVMTKPGAHSFQFYMDNGPFYEIYAGGIECKDRYKTVINLYFREAMDDRPVAEKPVIYLYPETDRDVSVHLDPTGELQFTYPAYGNGWKGTAHPDGSMTIAGKSYPYLFWDAQMHHQGVDVTSGWILEKDRVVAFLEEKLTAAGLNDREQADFITYWGPRLVGSPQVFLQFAWGTDADERFGALNVSPQPDHINRLYLLWTPLEAADRFTDPAPQELPVFDRSGFDVLEWGGMEFTQEQFATR
jgi:hypothetical protein